MRRPAESADEVVDPSALPFVEFAPRYLHIAPKRGGVIPFRLNEPQLRLDQIIEQTKAAGKPVRIIILKARQLGFSTYSLGKAYQYTTTHEGVMSFIASYDDDSVRDLFERVRLMYDLAPEKPMVRYSNRTELDFSNPDVRTRFLEPGMLSKIRIGTAGKTRLGRSKTLRYLHLSEVAFWENAKRVLLGLEQALPDDPETVEIIESTANGVGGEFYERWKRAENPDTRGEWQAVFFAWHAFPEYSRPLEGGVLHPVPSCVVDREDFEREELELRAMYDLTIEQVNWRRWAIVNKCGDDLESFRQEYPSTPQEAFLATGRPIFNKARLRARLRALELADMRAKEAGSPRYVRGKVVRDRGRVQFRPDPDGPLTIYKWPDQRSSYVIGGDSCRGVSNGPDPDFAEAHVYDAYSWEQVAVYRERVEATEFSKVLLLMGYLYGTAVLAPEVNDHGHTVVVKLQEANYRKIYLRQDPDELGNVTVEKPGWETNTKTRGIAIDAVDAALNGNYATFNDIPTLEQMLTFVRDPKTGKAGAAPGCHDDGVMATAIALAVMEHGPQPDRMKSPYVTPETDASRTKRNVQRHLRHAMAIQQRAIKSVNTGNPLTRRGG